MNGTTSSRIRRFLLAAGLGTALGALLALLVASDAPGYLGKSPAQCIKCHVMEPEFASWRHSVHRGLACTDCHLPHDNPVKYWAFKARDGLWDATVFYTRSEPQVIRLKERSKSTVRDNCMRCHRDAMARAEALGEIGWCGTCHRDAVHPGPLGIERPVILTREEKP